MSALKNPKFEKVAQELAALKSPEEASRSAGYPEGSSFGANARKRAQRGDIRARVDEIRAPAVERAEITAEWMLEKLREYVDYNIDDYLTAADASGRRYLDISKTDRRLLARLGEVTQDITELPVSKKKPKRFLIRTKIKGHSPIDAISLMAKIKGTIKDPAAEALGSLGARLGAAIERAARVSGPSGG